MESRSTNGVIIYKKMPPEEGDKILIETAEKLKNTITNENIPAQQKWWLLRESREAGCLTLQTIKYNNDTNKFESSMARFMLCNHGWILINENPNTVEYNNIIAKNGGKKQDMYAENENKDEVRSLLNCLNAIGFSIDERINPSPDQATKNHAYTKYTVNPLEVIPKEKINTMVVGTSRYTVPDDINQAGFFLPLPMANTLSCPITRNEARDIGTPIILMKEPVVLKSDGITYEKNNLLKRDPLLQERVHFYENQSLKNIIGYISAKEKTPEAYLKCLEKIDENELNDIMMFSKLENPVISPSGFSYECDALCQWIDSKKSVLEPNPFVNDPKNPNIKISRSDLCQNTNLKLFIDEWDKFYDEMKLSIKKQVANAKVN